jgi:hypothetical protein
MQRSPSSLLVDARLEELFELLLALLAGYALLLKLEEDKVGVGRVLPHVIGVQAKESGKRTLETNLKPACRMAPSNAGMSVKREATSATMKRPPFFSTRCASSTIPYQSFPIKLRQHTTTSATDAKPSTSPGSGTCAVHWATWTKALGETRS